MTLHERQYFRATFACAVGIALWLSGCKNENPVFDTELVVQSAPTPGASVSLNSQPYGVTPLHINGLPPGPVLIEITMDGFKRAYETYTVPDQGSKTVTLTMTQLVGTITIESDPVNSYVYLDNGTPLGVTPLKDIKLAEGTHTLEVRHDKYEPMKETIDITADYKYTKNFRLKAIGSQIEVFSTPTSAAIYLNNALQAEKTPTRIPVNPGTYTVGVYKDGYIMAEEVVNVDPAAQVTVTLTMKEGAVPQGMVLVPAGDFTMGTDDKSPDERPKRTVFVESFYIDKYEVTNSEYKEVFPAHVFTKGQDEFPVTGVTWEQATDFAKRTQRRLPTEVEWEKAARGTDAREYPWGALWDPELANVNTGQLNLKPMAVGQFRAAASPYGCLDMAGNVYEWTSSWYSAYPGNTEIIKEYGQVFRALRGGSFKKGPFEARCMTRSFDLVTNKRDDYGFRCAADVAKAPPGRLSDK